MSCMSRRKKDPKKSMLSPDDVQAAARSMTDPMGKPTAASSMRTAKTSPNLLDPNSAAGQNGISARRESTTRPGRTPSPSRLSVEGRTVKKSPSQTSLRTPAEPRGRVPDPHKRSPSVASNRSASSTRTANNSPASTRKSPVAQMREDFDALKHKNDENLELIAQQNAELEQLRQKLQVQASESTPSAAPAEDIVQNEVVQKLLSEKEELLRGKEMELEQLRQHMDQLELAQKEVPSIVVNDGQGDVPTHDEEIQKLLSEKEQLLASKEQLLASKERELEEMRHKYEIEIAEAAKPALAEVQEQLELLKSQNTEAASRLLEKESELNELREELEKSRHTNKADEEQEKRLRRLTVDLENEKLTMKKLEELNAQLEAQKVAHEETLRSHSETLAQKDKLLEQHAQALQELQAQHEAAFGDLQKKQEEQAYNIKDQHTNEMRELKERLTKAELGRNATVDDELERLLHEFEEAEHAHTVELANLEQSHHSQLSNLRESQQAQLQGLKNSQFPKNSNWRLMPTDAVSWPAPQPLSILRKTGGPRQRERKVVADDDGPDVYPQDPKKVQVYISSVSGNVNIKKNQEEIIQLLSTNEVKYELIDVASSEKALQHMKRQNGTSDGRAKEVPQVFVGGEYRGQYKDLLVAIEEGSLSTFLRAASEDRSALFSSKSTELKSSTKPSQKPTTNWKLGMDEDEALLEELEQELRDGRVHGNELDQL
ncbi:hypothetical protein K450DRAFT_217813 [Umbelopsis ramanniana AG]|uniref:Glutaredoxin domain-containing protein n=1 Tax=Umbelopsis ramanniana AG TaxID=1314678 RepID=A0AAD5EJ42_UMBRA|nr:uncharacterized protein K450DRAFT_217813 [Umbelopsis ramanniana AG]KAI8584743.1 hypothetical protein K450DRAFT_217813 [Umbelopsis ramanniana AG]